MDFTSVWDDNGFSPCFRYMVFGFGGNVVTIAAVAVLWLTQRSNVTNRNTRIHFLEKAFLHVVPMFGACLSLYEMFLLLQLNIHGSDVEYQKWLFRGSQFVSWVVILIVSKSNLWFLVLCDRILCFWWIIRPIMGIPHLQALFPSWTATLILKESCSMFAEIMFGLSVNIIRAIRGSSFQRNFGSVEDPLLSCDKEIDGASDVNLDSRNASYWDILTFKFVNVMMDQGVKKQLGFEDLVQLPTELLPSSCYHTILRCWTADQSESHSQPSLFRTIFHAYGWPYLRLGLLKVVNDGFGFIGPLLLNKLIKFLEQGSGHLDGYIFAFSLGLTSIFKSFLDTQYNFHLMKLKLKLRSSIMTLLYHKCLHVSLAERSKFSEGEVQTFMSIDADRTVNLANSFHDLWSLPIQIGVALYLLYTQVRFAFLSGIVLTILLIPVNKWISTLIANATGKMMKEKDERIRGTGELLTYIRTLKMYSWEYMFTERLMERRKMEVKHLSTRKYLDAWCVFFWATTPTLFSLFTFSAFTLMGHALDAATVFTCVALFNTLISPLNSFPWVINGMIDAIISAGRLSKFLSCPEHETPRARVQLSEQQDTEPAIVLQDACCVWSNGNEDGYRTILNNMTLNLPKGQLIAVIGEVGSGKSSLLNSILGEMQTVHGLIQSRGSVAYVQQVPWILSGSVRDNVLFGEKFNAERYGKVLQACALATDISRMNRGDLSYIGEKGLNLSGGQRARLALARAIYHDSDIYLLDDVLSAVDAQVALWIMEKAILSPLMNCKTRILCTHNAQAISAADLIVVMDKGYVKWSGNFSCFLLSPYSILSAHEPSEVALQHLSEKGNSSDNPNDKKLNLQLENDSDSISTSEETRDIAEIESRKEGTVELHVYKSYATFTGWSVASIICVSAFLMQASRNGNDLWLSHWVDSTSGTESTMFYLAVLAVLGGANSILTLVRAFSFSYGGLQAAIQVHARLLKNIVNAPVHFFDRNPSGRILNRFSSDLYMIDDSLPFILNILLANFLSLLGIAIVLSYSQITFLLLLLPFWYVYRKLQLYYRSNSRELRRLDSVSRSPIYSSFTETLDGSATIRAFMTEELFLTTFIKYVTLYQQTSFSEQTASLWLSLRLQLLAASVISYIAVMAVVGARGDLPINFGTPGLVGLSLSYAAPVVSLLSNFLTSFTETEKEMVSVERVLQYMDIPQEELRGSQTLHPDWPLHGHLEFEHVSLKYNESLPDALSDVSFKISSGMQVGIIGRTGAGKSSIINAIFRLTPICKGRILIDGLNVAGIDARKLREHLSVVPQTPFLFEGSLRDNLDPFGKVSDENIWEALEKCHVKEDVLSAGGLDTHIKECGVSFSVGQRQLICLARALIKSSKILCLDECTANVDTYTASVLQNTISNECKGITVLTIAHRISVVLNMDKILVLDNGLLVEEGSPEDLREDRCSRFASFARAANYM